MPKSIRQKFTTQRHDAKRRGVIWLLTYEEWLKIWMDSGHWHERGCKKGQYVMARYGDKGPYAVDNVRIVLVETNNSEGNHQGNTNAIGNISKGFSGQKHSIETREKIASSMRATLALKNTTQS